MKRYWRLALNALVLSCGLASQAVAQPKYSITDLGTLGGNSSYAYGINNSGHITGFSPPAANTNAHAFYYDGRMHDLGALGSSGSETTGSFSAGNKINDSDQIVGTTLDNAGRAQAFLWDNQHGMQRLGFQSIYGIAINNHGQVLAEAATSSSGQVTLAFIYDPASGTQAFIPALPGLGACLPNGEGINDLTQVVGYCGISTTIQAFVWDEAHGVIALAPGTIESLAWSINNPGEISGSITVALGVGRAVIWDASRTMHFLPLITDHQGNTLNTDGYSINDHGDVAGIASQNAAVWLGSAGYLLDDLTPPNSGWHLIQANGINNARQIVGYGTINGQTHGFLLNPMDTSPPIIVPEISGILGANGWYRSGVTVSWTVTDPESGIASSTGCSPVTVATDTPGTTLKCSATNGAGLSASQSVTIKIDKTPPVISGMPASGCTIWPPDHKLVQVANVTASDALSGLAPGSFAVTGTSSDPSNGQIVISGGSVQLGADKGQVYSLTATASDMAGNTATVTATCSVPHDQGN